MRVLPSRRLWTAIGLTAIGSASVVIVVSLRHHWADDSEETQRLRRVDMVATQIEARGVKHKGVLEAMRKVPRHRFVPAVWKGLAYR